jgi:hypothetical protein
MKFRSLERESIKDCFVLCSWYCMACADSNVLNVSANTVCTLTFPDLCDVEDIA